MMYGQGHQQSQNVYLNGGHGGQRFNLPVSKSFQPGHHTQQRPSESNAFSTQNGPPGPGYSGTPLSSQKNGAPLGNPQRLTEFASEQLSLAQAAREATGTHWFARNHPTQKSNVQNEDNNKNKVERGERGRAEDEESETWNELDLSGQGLPLLTPKLFDYFFIRKLYLTNNKLRSLPTQIGQLRNLTHLDVSINDLTFFPKEVGLLVNLQKLLFFDNHISEIPIEFNFLHHLEVLGFEGNPLDEDTRAIVIEAGTKALITGLQARYQGPDEPAPREWIEVLKPPKSAEDIFKILSYNILCDFSANPLLYGYTPASAIEWANRKWKILDDVREELSDIICLQEVETEAFNEFFRPELAQNGYRGIFFPRSRAKTMSERESLKVDGCATFFRNDKYILLEKQHIDMGNLAINRADMKMEHDVFNRVMPRDHIAVVTFLENRATGARLLVVNVHLFWNHQYKDVKIVQTVMLLDQLVKIADAYSKVPPCKDKKPYRYSDGDSDVKTKQTDFEATQKPSQYYKDGLDIPIIICGDLNSQVDSGVYELLATGRLGPNHADFMKFKYGKVTREGSSHPFGLKTAYNKKQLPFSNYVPGFKDHIDYIWYSAQTLQVLGLRGEIDPDYAKRVPGFPNIHYPSDHIVLAAEFATKQRLTA